MKEEDEEGNTVTTASAPPWFVAGHWVGGTAAPPPLGRRLETTLWTRSGAALRVTGHVTGVEPSGVFRTIGSAPLLREDLLEISYQFDATMFFPWVVTDCRLLAPGEREQLPLTYFYQYFEGCSCPRCALKTWQQTEVASSNQTTTTG
jgi:hypothetical protein